MDKILETPLCIGKFQQLLCMMRMSVGTNVEVKGRLNERF